MALLLYSEATAIGSSRQNRLGVRIAYLGWFPAAENPIHSAENAEWMGHPYTRQIRGFLRQAQDRLFDYATHDEAVSHSAQRLSVLSRGGLWKRRRGAPRKTQRARFPLSHNPGCGCGIIEIPTAAAR